MRIGKSGSAVGRIGGFGSNVVLTGVASLLTIPVVSSYAGPESWAAIAVGQSIGTLAGAFVALGWAQTGPTDVARSDNATRARIYGDSLGTRFLAGLIALPPVLLLSFVLSHNDRLTTSGAAVSALLIAAGSNWFFVGMGSPRLLMLCDSAPRIVGLLVGMSMTMVSHDGVYTALGLAIGSAASILVSFNAIRRRYGAIVLPKICHVPAVVRGQVDGIGIALFSTTYLSVPLLFLTALFPASTAAYGVLDRIKQQAMMAFTPVAQAAQGWVPQVRGDELRVRVVYTAKRALVLGAVASALFVLFAYPAVAILSAGKIAVDSSLVVPIGAALGMNVATLVIGNTCLLALRAGREVFVSALGGTAAVVGLLAVLPSIMGPSGVAWAVAGAQLTVLLIQVLALRRKIRR